MSRPMRSPIAASSTFSVSVGAPALRASGDDVIDGQQQELHAARLRARQDVARRIELVVLDERLADRLAQRLEERVGHGAADEQRSTRGIRFSMTSILSETLAPPRRRRTAARDRPSAAEVAQLLLHQQPGPGLAAPGARSPRPRRARDARRRRRRSRRRRPARPAFAKRRRRSFSSSGWKRRFSSRTTTPPGGFGRTAALGRLRRCSRRRSATGRAEQLGERAATGLQAHLGIGLALRPAEVRGQDDGRAPAFERVLDRRQRRADARVVADDAVLERDVEVDADEDAL